MRSQFMRGVHAALVFVGQVVAGFVIVVSILALYGAWKHYSVHARVGPWTFSAEPKR